MPLMDTVLPVEPWYVLPPTLGMQPEGMRWYPNLGQGAHSSGVEMKKLVWRSGFGRASQQEQKQTQRRRRREGRHAPVAAVADLWGCEADVV